MSTFHKSHFSHFIQKFTGKMPQTRMSPERGHTLCASLRSRYASTFHKSHFIRKFTGKRPQTRVSTPGSSTGLYTYRKNPSVSVDTLFGEKRQWFLVSPFFSTTSWTHRIHGATIYGNIYHQYTPNVSIYQHHGSYGETPIAPYPPDFRILKRITLWGLCAMTLVQRFALERLAPSRL